MIGEIKGFALTNYQKISFAVDQAIKCLQDEEPQLDFAIVHERSTAHRLAVHLESFFSGWNVDCEYNRDVFEKKMLESINECDSNKSTDAIFPDIIFHHRKQTGHENNLLVIELKKSSKSDPCDDMKLRLLTSLDHGFHYQLGLYINVNGGAFDRTWYLNGSTVVEAVPRTTS